MSRSSIYDQRTGRTWNYSRQADEVLFHGVFVPKHGPAWMNDNGRLWNAAEEAETRKNSRPARSFIVALPNELTDEQNRHLLIDFTRENFQRKGIAAEVTMHVAGREGDQRNVHAHILITTRDITAEGFGAKNRDIDKKATLQDWRDRWQEKVNQQLQRHGHEARINMRSYAEQGREEIPGIHVGRNAMAQERRGQTTDRGDDLRSIRNQNIARMIARELHAIEFESTTDRLNRQDREDREKALKQAERDLARSTKASAADRELLSAVRRLMVTMGIEMRATTGLDRDQLRGAGQQLRAEAIDERRNRQQQHDQAQQIRDADSVPLGRDRDPARRQPGPIVPDLKQRPAAEQDGMKPKAPKKTNTKKPAQQLGRILQMEPRRRRRRPEDEPL